MQAYQILLSLTFLSIASIYDLKTREVPNKIWLIFIPLSSILTIIQILNEPSQIYLVLASIVFTSLIAVIIFYVGLYGGADAKALITLAIAHPTNPSQLITNPILPFSAFNNSLILMVLTIPIALIKNLYWQKKNNQSLFKGLGHEPLWKKMFALLVCLKKTKSEMKNYHVPAERYKIVGGKRRTLKIFQRVNQDDFVVDDTVPEEAFVIYSQPMLPFITLGYILAIIWGDLILHIIMTLS
jgi:preflagellin peptidase FlaK